MNPMMPMGGCPGMGMQMGMPQMGNPMMMQMGGAMPMGVAMNPMMMTAMPCGTGMPMMPCAVPCAMGCFPGMPAAMPMATACCPYGGMVPTVPSVPAAPTISVPQAPSTGNASSSTAKAATKPSGDQDEEDKEGGMSSEQRAVVVRALKEIAAKESEKKKAEKVVEKVEEKPKDEAEEYDKIPRCHLHKKPNAKCKKCQQVLAAQNAKEDLKAKEKDYREEKTSESKTDELDEHRRFNCSPMLKDQILKSSYFKSLLEIKTLDGLVQEIPQYVDTLDVYSPGSKTAPSCFICHVYRLFTMKEVFEDELNEVITHDNALVRCVGFVYIRFVMNPNSFLEVLEEFLYDDMEIPGSQDTETGRETIGEFVEALLIREKYFDTPMPRIPVKARQAVEEKIAPMPQYRKRMQANRKVFIPGSIEGMEVQVSVDGEWQSGKAMELVGKAKSRDKLRVILDNGTDLKAPLGKVVLVGPDDSDESGSEGGNKPRRRSRSPRRRGRSPDWSRYKGKSDAEMLQELRSRARDGAVIGTSKTYSRRQDVGPTSAQHADQSSAQRRGAQDDEAAIQEARRRAREEEERQRRMQQHDIYAKYCAQTSVYSSSGTSAGNKNEIIQPDVLRLG